MKRSLGPELPSELRAEFERSRRAGHDYDVLGKLPQLRAALTAAQPSADGSSPDASSTAPGPGTGALHVVPSAWKLVVLAAVAGTTVLGAWYVQRRPLDAQQKVPAAVAPPTVQAPEPTAIEAKPSAIEAKPSAIEAKPSAIEAKPSATEAPAHAIVADQPEPAPSPEPAVRSSRREIAQVVRIRALLERDPRAAYLLAQRSEREFPHGVLSEERQALQVLALAKSGATDAAQRKAQEFFARYPQSPMRERLEAALRR